LICREGDRPLVSIVTPAYNSARFILEAIESVQAQTYPCWELIVVDDCSQDNTRELVESKAEEDERIILIRLAQNRGTAVARDTAMEKARGRYVAFLDSDDLWLPNKLEEQLDFMKKKDAAFSFSSYRTIDETGKPLGAPVLVPSLIDYKGLLKNTTIGCLTVMLDRSKTGPLSMSNTLVKRGQEDYVLWFRLLRCGLTAHGVQKELARYRLLQGSLSRDKVRAARRMWKLYREVEGLSLPYSAWCFSNYALRAYLKRWRSEMRTGLRTLSPRLKETDG
jgi:teichuronic acid biosynthesis glycosyltransferase TuaG